MERKEKNKKKTCKVPRCFSYSNSFLFLSFTWRKYVLGDLCCAWVDVAEATRDSHSTKLHLVAIVGSTLELIRVRFRSSLDPNRRWQWWREVDVVSGGGAGGVGWMDVLGDWWRISSTHPAC